MRTEDVPLHFPQADRLKSWPPDCSNGRRGQRSASYPPASALNATPATADARQPPQVAEILPFLTGPPPAGAATHSNKEYRYGFENAGIAPQHLRRRLPAPRRAEPGVDGPAVAAGLDRRGRGVGQRRPEVHAERADAGGPPAAPQGLLRRAGADGRPTLSRTFRHGTAASLGRGRPLAGGDRPPRGASLPGRAARVRAAAGGPVRPPRLRPPPAQRGSRRQRPAQARAQELLRIRGQDVTRGGAGAGV